MTKTQYYNLAQSFRELRRDYNESYAIITIAQFSLKDALLIVQMFTEGSKLHNVRQLAR